MVTANDIIQTMYAMKNEQQSIHLMRFFKKAKGQYGEGDRFLGIKVPLTRAVVREAKCQVPLSEVEKLLYSEWHEIRLCGFLILVDEMKAVLPAAKRAGNPLRRCEIKDFYLRHVRQANNWDLGDLSWPGILGAWLLCIDGDGQRPQRQVLDYLAVSKNLWEQRIAIVSTLALIRANQYADTFRIATLLLANQHDLIHKAVGWMLREVGKRDMNALRTYLTAHVHELPRTSLRYAIERMDTIERRAWMQL